MKATQHTPAPWSIEWDHQSNSPEFIRAFVDGEMEDIAIISPDTPLANARLIAAAPELLDSLKDLENILSCKPYDRDEQKLLVIARAAIAKAKGEIK
jgi:hypothetical protein